MGSYVRSLSYYSFNKSPTQKKVLTYPPSSDLHSPDLPRLPPTLHRYPPTPTSSPYHKVTIGFPEAPADLRAVEKTWRNDRVATDLFCLRFLCNFAHLQNIFVSRSLAGPCPATPRSKWALKLLWKSAGDTRNEGDGILAEWRVNIACFPLCLFFAEADHGNSKKVD